MSSSKILSVKRSDAPDEVVLIKATKTGKNDIDVDLLATEGTSPFTGKVRERKLQDLRSKSYEGDDESFKTILKYVLDGGDALPKVKATKDLEIVAEISGSDPNQKLTIVLRKRIEQITQRVGSLELKQNDDEEVQLFDWTGLAVKVGREQTVEVADLTAKLAAAQEIIKKLEKNLEDLVKVKAEQEDAMFSQFAALLNEKKLKIRNQQRIISSANIDKSTLEGLERAAEGASHKATGSRKGKRKATEPAADSESSDGFDTMDAGEPRNRGDFQADTESDRESTPDPETASENSERELDEPPHDSPIKTGPTRSNARTLKRQISQPPSLSPPAASQLSQRSTRRSGTKEASASQTAATQSGQRTTRKDGKEADSGASPPPKRDLPFTRRKHSSNTSKADAQGKEQSPKEAPSDPVDDDQETASDDDEL